MQGLPRHLLFLVPQVHFLSLHGEQVVVVSVVMVVEAPQVPFLSL